MSTPFVITFAIGFALGVLVAVAVMFLINEEARR